MKYLASLSAASALALLALFTGCTSTTTSPMSRVDENRTEYETWSIEVKQAVLDGRVEKGMTQKQVEVAIGKPAKVEYKDGRKNAQEVWIYTKGGGSNPLKGSTVSVGTYGIGVNTAPIGGGGNYEEKYEIVFENGVVVSSDVPATR